MDIVDKPLIETRFLPYSRQSIDESEIDAVVRVMKSDWLTTGPELGKFETEFADAVQARHAVACSSGTAALHIALLALGIGPGDHVVVPSISFLSTANVVRHVGAEVVFADVDPDTGLITPETLQDALRRSETAPAAVMVVHMAGQVADMKAIGDIADAHSLKVVEDSCHALGGTGQQGEPVGSCRYSDMATFSLHPVKTIAAGEGGVVTTNDAELSERLKCFRNNGVIKSGFENTDQALAEDGTVNPWYYEMPEPGFNYRLSDIHAVIGRMQLKKLNAYVERRRDLARRYDTLIAGLSPAVEPKGRVPCGHAFHLYTVAIDFTAAGMDRAHLMHALREMGIGTQVHFIPLHRQPYYEKRYGKPDLPGADDWYCTVLSLPLFPAMADTDVDRVVDTLKQILARV